MLLGLVVLVCVSCTCLAPVPALQKDMLRRSGVELVLLGHGMTADVDKAELYEIEWPEGMQKFDTQTLYMAWQLKQLDAAAAAKALYAVVASE